MNNPAVQLHDFSSFNRWSSMLRDNSVFNLRPKAVRTLQTTLPRKSHVQSISGVAANYRSYPRREPGDIVH